MKRSLPALAAFLCLAAPAYAQLQLSDAEKETIRLQTVSLDGKTLQENDTTRVISTDENLLFKVAKDRPFERTPGTVGPIEIDSYIYFKFEKLEKQMKAFMDHMDARLDRLEETLKMDPAVKNALQDEVNRKKLEVEAKRKAEGLQVYKG